MVDIRVISRAISEEALSSDVAANPYYASSVMRPLTGRASSATWCLDGYPPAGAVLFSGNWSRRSESEGGLTRLKITLEQGGRAVVTSTTCEGNSQGRYGIAFVNDGGPYCLTYEVEDVGEDRSGAALEIFPLDTTCPIGESSKPRLFKVLDNGPKAIVSCNQGGLMNRLVPLLSAMCLGREANLSVYCWWGDNHHCAAQLDDLFIPEQVDVDASQFATDYRVYSAYENCLPLEVDTSTKAILLYSVSPIRTNIAGLDSGYDAAGQAFRTLRLAPDVQRAIDSHAGTDFSRTIAFHIRRPYPNQAFAEQERSKFTLTIDVFKDLIARLREDFTYYKKVLICTNDMQTEADLVTEFGDYIIVNKKTTIDNTTDPVAVKEAIVDVSLMSKCPLIFSQDTSAFGRFAHCIGRNMLFSITSRTNKESFHFYRFERGVHTSTLTTPRTDISELIRIAQPS